MIPISLAHEQAAPQNDLDALAKHKQSARQVGKVGGIRPDIAGRGHEPRQRIDEFATSPGDIGPYPLGRA
jgi:hypothetical protein